MDEKLKNRCQLVCLQKLQYFNCKNVNELVKNSCDKHLEICTYLGMNFIDSSFQKLPR